MTLKLQELQEKIKQLKRGKKQSGPVSGTQGYSIAIVILTDLISCILVGLGIGLLFQKILHTSILLTAGLTLLGGIAGLYNAIRFAIEQDKK